MEYKLSDPHILGQFPISEAQPDPNPNIKTGLWICEQAGRIFKYDPSKFVKNDFKVEDHLILDISHESKNLKKAESSFGDERGVIGLAIHPDFEKERKFYVHYSSSSNTKMNEKIGSNDHFSVISEFILGPDIDYIKQSERILFTIPQPQFNHNGGSIIYTVYKGKKYLIMGLGDGGGKNDEHPNQIAEFGEISGNAVLVGSDRKNLLGTLLVIDMEEFEKERAKLDSPSPSSSLVASAAEDEFETWLNDDSKESQSSVQHTKPKEHYTIENLRKYIQDNCISAVGLRNPFKITLHDNVDVDDASLYIADVGQSKYERVLKLSLKDAIESKKPIHFGWNAFEGISDYENAPAINEKSRLYMIAKDQQNVITNGAKNPFVLYDRSEKPISAVIGGYIDEKTGNYIYGDYNGQIFVKPSSGPETSSLKLTEGEFLHSFAINAEKEIFVISFSKNESKIYKIQENVKPVPKSEPAISLSIETPILDPKSTGPEKEVATVTVTATSTSTPTITDTKTPPKNSGPSAPPKKYEQRLCFENPVECKNYLNTEMIEKLFVSLEKSEKEIKSKIRKVGNEFVSPKMTRVILIGTGVYFYQISCGSWFLSLGIAETKAITAFGLSSDKENAFTTKSLQHLTTPYSAFWGLNTVHPEHQLTPIPGGVPVYDENGILLGAVGISGDHPDVDHEVAVSGVENAGFFINPYRKSEKEEISASVPIESKSKSNPNPIQSTKQKPKVIPQDLHHPKKKENEVPMFRHIFPTSVDPEKRYAIASTESDPKNLFIYDRKNTTDPLQSVCTHRFRNEEKLISWYEKRIKSAKIDQKNPICPLCLKEARLK